MTAHDTGATRPPSQWERVDLAPAAAEVKIGVGGVARLARCGNSARWSQALAVAVEEARGLLDPHVRIATVAGDVTEALISAESPVHAIAAGKPGWIYVATIGKALELRVQEHMRESREYDEAMRSYLARKPFKLKGPSQRYPTREELHDRPRLR